MSGFHTLARRAGLQACCIADFQVGSAPDMVERRRFGNLRNGRFGNPRCKVRHNFRALGCEIFGLAFVAFTVVASAGAESFVKNQEELGRMERALPAQALVKPAQPRRLLIFTLNVGYPGHPSIAYANEALSRMGAKTGAFTTAVTNDPQVFEAASLRRFNAVFFNNTVGNCFTNTDLRRSLLEFISGGGGLLGVHGTTVAFMQWPGATEDWPEFGYLIGARGANHKDSDEHVWLKLDDTDNPILSVFNGQGFDYRDEFFRPQGTYSRSRVRVLLSIDTSKTDPNKGQARGNCYRADNDYAAAWIRSYGRGRVFYCTIAHNPYVFWDERMLRFYLAAVQFALGDLACPTTPSAWLSPAVRAQEKLGWRVAFESGRAEGASLLASAERAAELGLACCGGASIQSLSADNPRPFTPLLTDAELEQARLKLESIGVRLLTYRVDEPPEEPAASARLFEFARKVGVDLLVLERPPRNLAPLEEGSNATGIRVAFRADTPDAALRLADICRARSPQFGVCLDLSGQTGLWRESGPVVRALGERLFGVQIPESNGDMAWLTEKLLGGVREVAAHPIVLVGKGQREGAAESLRLLNSAAMKLSADQATAKPRAASSP